MSSKLKTLSKLFKIYLITKRLWLKMNLFLFTKELTMFAKKPKGFMTSTLFAKTLIWVTMKSVLNWEK